MSRASWFSAAIAVLLSCVGATDVHSAEIDAGKYESLQAAADAIPEDGGVLRIPPGKYELDKPLHIKTGDTLIIGSGAATHLVNRNESGQPAILIEHPRYADQEAPRDERLWRVKLADLRVTGNEKSGAGIDARYIEELFVQGVSASYHGGDGLRLVFCYEDPRLSDNLLTYNGRCGIYLEGCHDIVVSANQFEENQTGLKCSDGFNLAMSGNNLDDHLGDGIVIENTYGSVVAGNMIEECQGWGMVLDRDVYGTTVSANVIAHEFTGGIDLRDAHGCAVTGNTFTIVKKIGLLVGPKSGSINITGNNFSDSLIGRRESGKEIQKRPVEASKTEDNPNEAAGIVLDGCESIVVSGNLFSRLSSEPLVKRGNCRQILTVANGAHLEN